MPPAVQAPTTAAPPADPVRAALDDEDLRRRLAAKARAVLRGRTADHDGAVQAVYLRALETRHNYNPDLGSVTGWVFGVATNVFRELARADAHRPRPTDLWGAEVPDRPDREIDLAHSRFQVTQFLTRLPADLQAAVKLRHLEGLEYAELAGRLGITVVLARMRVCRGLKRLQELARHSPTEGRP